jgi:hypothetical protein
MGWRSNVLTALGKRDIAVQDAERRAGDPLRTITHDEGLSAREAVERAAAASHCGKSLSCAALADQHPGG